VLGRIGRGCLQLTSVDVDDRLCCYRIQAIRDRINLRASDRESARATIHYLKGD